MAEMTVPAAKGHGAGVPRGKKLSTRVDLTPMVDLGFLLITFFIFTTQLAKPVSMKLIMPANGKGTEVGDQTALTVIPFDKNQVFYYHGELEKALAGNLYGITGYSLEEGIGAVIRQKQQALDLSGKGRKEMMLIIKPAEGSVYRNTVDILDEVVINDIKRYALTEISPEETQTLHTRVPH